MYPQTFHVIEMNFGPWQSKAKMARVTKTDLLSSGFFFNTSIVAISFVHC